MKAAAPLAMQKAILLQNGVIAGLWLKIKRMNPEFQMSLIAMGGTGSPGKTLKEQS